MRIASWIGVICAILIILGLSPLRSAAVLQLTRGPYLQLVTATEATVCWNTSQPADSRVDYGINGYEKSVADPDAVSRHALRLSGLRQGSRYHYQVISGGRVLRTGLLLQTNKLPGTPFSFAVLGDSGSGSTGQYRIAGQMARVEPDFILHTGDVVYPRGEEKDYDAHFFRPYAALLARVALWPALGNHDIMRTGGRAYLSNFHLPHTGPDSLPLEHCYSFDYADAHIATVDSNLSERVLRGTAAPWLQRDLAASPRRWKFVFFHHPPYSSGLHGESKPIQRALVPVLTRAQVDIVFNGHDHTYERIRPQQGVTYIVTGAGGGPLYRKKYNRPYTARFYNRLHSFTLVNINGGRLRLRQIDAAGSVVDETEWRK